MINLGRIMVVTIAIAIVAIIGGSITSVNVPQGMKIGGNENGYASSSGGTQLKISMNMFYMVSVVIYSLIAVSVVGLLVYRKYVLKDALYSLIAALAFILIFSIIPFVLKTTKNIDIGFGSSPSSTPGGYNPSGFFFYIISGFFIGIIAYAIIEMYRTREKKKKEEKKEEYKKYVERAIYHIEIGQDIRGSILRAYKEMEEMMRKRGVKDQYYYTPREFENFAISTLNLSKEPVETLTQLFEYARYSNRIMSEKDRREAINSLEAIKNELEK